MFTKQKYQELLSWIQYNIQDYSEVVQHSYAALLPVVN